MTSEADFVDLIFDIHNCPGALYAIELSDPALAARVRAVIDEWKEDSA